MKLKIKSSFSVRTVAAAVFSLAVAGAPFSAFAIVDPNNTQQVDQQAKDNRKSIMASLEQMIIKNIANTAQKPADNSCNKDTMAKMSKKPSEGDPLQQMAPTTQGTDGNLMSSLAGMMGGLMGGGSGGSGGSSAGSTDGSQCDKNQMASLLSVLKF